MSDPVILSRQRTAGVFIRTTGYSLETGKAVAYVLQGHKFRIIATRLGVDLAGSFPIVQQDGVNILVHVLQRAVRHHEHLASFADGQPQTILNEDALDAEDSVVADVPPSLLM
jgi:hypothetical protein